jgi:hypothetical protein
MMNFKPFEPAGWHRCSNNKEILIRYLKSLVPVIIDLSSTFLLECSKRRRKTNARNGNEKQHFNSSTGSVC